MAALPRPSRIWVLPNRRTAGLVAVLLGMWYAGASQGNAAAYLLCFLLLAVVLVSMLHTWANLRGLVLRAENIRPVFAGEVLAVPVLLESIRGKPHFGLELRAGSGKAAATIATLEPAAPQRLELRLPARCRGCFSEISVRLSSSFPLGFLTAQRRVFLRQNFCIYPTPRGTLPLPRALAQTRQPNRGTAVAGDDYGGLRAWQPGESQRHIDWKAAARGLPLLTKQWTGEAEEILRLDWAALPSLDTEARLSQLARWIVLAENGSTTYELHLPGRKFPAARGDTHYHACLRALAEMPKHSSEQA